MIVCARERATQEKSPHMTQTKSPNIRWGGGGEGGALRTVPCAVPCALPRFYSSTFHLCDRRTVHNKMTLIWTQKSPSMGKKRTDMGAKEPNMGAYEPDIGAYVLLDTRDSHMCDRHV